jgi:hypothetical protein
LRFKAWQVEPGSFCCFVEKALCFPFPLYAKQVLILGSVVEKYDCMGFSSRYLDFFAWLTSSYKENAILSRGNLQLYIRYKVYPQQYPYLSVFIIKVMIDWSPWAFGVLSNQKLLRSTAARPSMCVSRPGVLIIGWFYEVAGNCLYLLAP